MSLSVAVAGASGYAGGEMLRLLSQHPEFDVVTVTAHSNAFQPLVSVHPHLRSLAGMSFGETTPEQLAGHDVVVLALPHGQSAALASQLGDDVLVVDLGADHRLERETDWQRFYGDGFVPSWPYGMPELPAGDGLQRRNLRGVQRIAVPGCNVTAITFALAPVVQTALIDTTDIVAVLAVGPSGAGRTLKPNLLASELLGNAQAYAVGGTHRHIPEIQQNLRSAGAEDVRISFTPVLVPTARGILATVTAPIRPGTTLEAVESAFHASYDDERFIHVLPRGEFPRVSDVVGSNTALVGVTIDEAAGRLVSICAIDNLVKGTAGAAVQSMNVALGFDEGLGLNTDGVAP